MHKGRVKKKAMCRQTHKEQLPESWRRSNHTSRRVFKRSPCLGRQRILAKITTDIRQLASKSHLGRLGLTAKTAEAVLDHRIHIGLGAIIQGNDAVDLEIQLGLEEGGQGRRVDEAGGAGDEQYTARVRVDEDRVLGRLDAVPGHAGPMAVDVEAERVAEGEEAVGRVPPEEDDLGGAAKVATLGLGGVDMGGKDAAGGAHGVDGGHEAVRGQGRGQLDDEDGTVEGIWDIGRSISPDSYVTIVFDAEAHRQLLLWCIFGVGTTTIAGHPAENGLLVIILEQFLKVVCGVAHADHICDGPEAVWSCQDALAAGMEIVHQWNKTGHRTFVTLLIRGHGCSLLTNNRPSLAYCTVRVGHNLRCVVLHIDGWMDVDECFQGEVEQLVREYYQSVEDEVTVDVGVGVVELCLNFGA